MNASPAHMLSANTALRWALTETPRVDKPANQPHDASLDVEGNTMNEPTVTRDWAERRLSELDHKLDLERTKSDLKFERLFGELQHGQQTTLAKMDARFAQVDGLIARTETNLTRWIMALVFTLLGLAASTVYKFMPQRDTAKPTAEASMPKPDTVPNPALLPAPKPDTVPNPALLPAPKPAP